MSAKGREGFLNLMLWTFGLLLSLLLSIALEGEGLRLQEGLALRQEGGGRGCKVEKEEIKLSLFADKFGYI